MEYVVVDTNIIVSAFINSSGSPAGVLSTVILDEGIVLCYNDDILSEYLKVLAREKFARYGFDMAEINGLLADITQNACAGHNHRRRFYIYIFTPYPQNTPQ